MDAFYEFGIQVILFLQGLGGWLEWPMKAFTFLGSEEFFLLLAPILYWCISPEAGLRVGMYLTATGGINSTLKLAFHAPRPYWLDPRVTAMGSEISFGIPSAHAQNTLVVWGVIADFYKRAWGWILALLLVFFIGLSRIYLGLHFPMDVVGGWLIGGMLLWFALKVEPGLRAWLKRQSPWMQVLTSWIASLVLILPGIITHWALRDWSVPIEWVENAAAATPGTPLDPLSLDRIITPGGMFFGLALGAIWLRQQGKFDPRGAWWQLILRYVVGLAGILIIWKGLGTIFPSEAAFIPYVLRYIRYGLAGAWLTGAAPWLFRKLHLAETHPPSLT